MEQKQIDILDEKEASVLKRIIQSANKIAVLTGAGVSTASGIPDFRSENGLYNNKSVTEEFVDKPEYILSTNCYERDIEKFYKFFNHVMVGDKEYEPCGVHKFIANLEKSVSDGGWGKQVTVITQNIDGLHQKAGSTNVQEVHGTLKTFKCRICGKRWNFNEYKQMVARSRAERKSEVPTHECEAALGFYSEKELEKYNGEVPIETDVVLYGMGLPDKAWTESRKALKEADLLLIFGTSLTVSPVNWLPTDYDKNYHFRTNKTPEVIVFNIGAVNTGMLRYARTTILNMDMSEAVRKIEEA